MPYAALERMLRPERLRQRAARRGGFSTPSLCKTAVGEDSLPLLATNMRGTFLSTRRDVEGLAPFGFSHVPIGGEGPLLAELFRVLWALSTQMKWSNRCSTVAAAVEQARALGVEPRSLVLSESLVGQLLGQDLDAARKAMATQGNVTVVDGMQVLLSDLPPGKAFVAAHPAAVGVYTRVGDHLGVLLQRVDRSIMMVHDVDVA